MKLPYEYTGLLLEALNDLLQNCEKDIEAITNENKCVKPGIPREIATKLFHKRNVVEHLIKTIRKGKVKF